MTQSVIICTFTDTFVFIKKCYAYQNNVPVAEPTEKKDKHAVRTLRERREGGWVWGWVFMPCMAVVVYDYRPSHPYNTGTEYVRFSPTRQALLAG